MKLIAETVNSKIFQTIYLVGLVVLLNSKWKLIQSLQFGSLGAPYGAFALFLILSVSLLLVATVLADLYLSEPQGSGSRDLLDDTNTLSMFGGAVALLLVAWLLRGHATPRQSFVFLPLFGTIFTAVYSSIFLNISTFLLKVMR